MRRIIRQHDEKDCGPACLAMIASAFEIEIPLIKCRESLKTDNNGTSVYAMVKGANQIGLEAMAYECTTGELENGITDGFIKFPFVAHTISDNEYLHYVVIYKISNNSVIIGDPAQGLIKNDKCRFYEMWTGIIINYSRKENSEKIKTEEDTNVIIKTILLQQKSKIVLIGIISFFITLIGLVNILFIQYLIDYVNNIEKSSDVSYEGHHHIFISDSGDITWINDVILNIEHILNDYVNIIIIFVMVCIIQLILKIKRGRTIAQFVQQFDLGLVQNTYNKCMKLPLDYYENRRTGEIITRFADTSRIREAITKIMMTILNDSVLVLMFGYVLFLINKVYFAGVIIILLIYAVVVMLEKEPLKKVNSEILQKNEKVVSYITNTFSTILTVKLFNKGGFEQRMTSTFYKLTQSIKKGVIIHTIVEGISSFISSVGAIIVLALGVNQCIEGKLSIGMLVACYMIAGLLIEPIKNLSNLQEDFQGAFVAIDRLNDILMAKNEENRNKVLNKDTIESIDINELSFSYGYREKILKEINLKVKKGDKVAIVGETGCGKSTLAKLLIGFYNSYNGSISYNGYDIRTISVEEIRNRVAYLSQNTDIYSDTIKNNIIMDRTNITEEDFIKACKVSLVDEIIDRLPQGFDSMINEKGYDLSQGEKQRIALARAIVGNPEVIVLDEATSNLDYISEKRILENINNYYNEKTIIFIAHRLSTVINCNKIVTIKDGKIAESGTHKELISLNGIYANMYRTQNSDE